MMKDRPVLSYQDDTVPNRLLGRGTVEKAFNMQKAIDADSQSLRLVGTDHKPHDCDGCDSLASWC